MQPKKQSAYRLHLCEGFLKEAEQDFGLKRWRSCVDNSQLSVENAGKAIIAIFAPVEKTHDPSLQLKRIIEKADIPDVSLKPQLEKTLPLFGELGFEQHFLSEYGKEEEFQTPWELFGKEDAAKSLQIARECHLLASAFFDSFFGPRECMEVISNDPCEDFSPS